MADGLIYREDAYAQGKMLDHSGWYGKLPRNITPSDIDSFVGNKRNGCFLFWELSRNCSQWASLVLGQRQSFYDLVKIPKIIAVLATHHRRLPSGFPLEPIHTDADIKTFQILAGTPEGRLEVSAVYDHAFWPWDEFVKTWFEKHDWIREGVLNGQL